MDNDVIQTIVSEIQGKIEEPSAYEIQINPDAIKSRALEMARYGYKPTKYSIMAIEYYLKGYGLWLSGGVGTGKTMFFKCLRPLNIRLRRTGQLPQIVILPMVRTLEMSVDDIRDWLNDNIYNEVVLDDVGSEPVYNHFGGKFDILPYILDKRLDSPCRTHATSNLTAKDMATRYGDARIIDRFSEMFVKIPFCGSSMRLSRPNSVIRKAQEQVLASAEALKRNELDEKAPSCAPKELAG